MKVGYARVSTEQQNLALQQDALEKAGCDEIYFEKISGSKASRPEYDRMKGRLRQGDKVIVFKLDRLGRSLKNLITEVEYFHKQDIEILSLQENIDTSTSGGKLFFHIFASIAEFEKDIIRERTKAGLDSARARGRVGGRPFKLTDAENKMVYQLHQDSKHKVDDVCKMFNISRPTFYRIVQKQAKYDGNCST